MTVNNIEGVQEVTAAQGKILAYVSNETLQVTTKLYKNPNTIIGAKEFDTIEQAEQYFGVAYEQPSE